MRRSFSLLLPAAVFLAPFPSLAQTWHWVSPKPQGVAVNGMTFVGSQGWYVGALGTIATTTDGARTFQPQSSGTFANLNAVFFYDAKHGWAVGDSGTILATSDGGQHWAPQNSQSSRRLRGVWFTSPTKGFAVGDYRTLLETTDGGQNWGGLGSPVLSLNSIVFTDSQHGFICGDGGAILITTDGGTNFNVVQTGTTQHLLAIAFADPNHGYAVGQGGAVVTTSDGGHSWSPKTVGTTDLTGVVALSATQVFALSTFGEVYATADGSTWKQVAVLQAFGANPFAALAVEGDGSLDATTQGGQWFHSQPLPQPDGGLTPSFSDVNDLFSRAGDITAVAFGSQDAGVMIGELGFLFSTQDRGQHINLVGPPDAGADIGWDGVCMPTPTDAYAVGTQGTVAVSHDSGKTWSLIPVPITLDFTAVDFIDAMHGVVASAVGLFLTTDNGGASWNIVGSAIGGNVTSLSYIDPQHGVAAAPQSVEVAWTTDGQDYSATGVGMLPFATAYPAPGLIFIGGSYPGLLHSLDEGHSFIAFQPLLETLTGADVMAMAFLDHQNGYLGFGQGSGVIYATNDAAQTFNVQFSGASSILGLSFPDRLHGFAVGGNGALIATDFGGLPPCQSDADCVDAGTVGVQCLSGACQACTQDNRCGPNCGSCGGSSPFCYGAYCAGCLNDLDCPDYQDGGYCAFGTCITPGGFDLDAGPGDAGEEDGGGDGGLDAGPDGGGATTGGTTGRPPTTTGGTGTSGTIPNCSIDPSRCGPSSGCGCTQGGGTEVLFGVALWVAALSTRRKRS